MNALYALDILCIPIIFTFVVAGVGWGWYLIPSNTDHTLKNLALMIFVPSLWLGSAIVGGFAAVGWALCVDRLASGTWG